jgi:hypothetical protein
LRAACRGKIRGRLLRLEPRHRRTMLRRSRLPQRCLGALRTRLPDLLQCCHVIRSHGGII